MDNKTRKETLEAKIHELQFQRQDTDKLLAGARSALNGAAAKRAELVAELGAAKDDATTAWAESELDRIDCTIRSHTRFIEGYETRLAKIATELAPLSNELAEVSAEIGRQQTEAAYREWETSMVREFRAASESLGAARVALASLQSAAVKGANEFGGRAAALLQGLFQDFLHQGCNPRSFGWRDSRPIYEMTRIVIEPVTKQEAAVGR
jgi:hypothetical protein